MDKNKVRNFFIVLVVEVCERRWRQVPCQCPTEGKDRRRFPDPPSMRRFCMGAILTSQDLPFSIFYRRWSASTKTGTRFYPRPCLQDYLRLFNQRRRAILIKVYRWARRDRSRYPSSGLWTVSVIRNNHRMSGVGPTCHCTCQRYC